MAFFDVQARIVAAWPHRLRPHHLPSDRELVLARPSTPQRPAVAVVHQALLAARKSAVG